jgi:hypothetical protein
MKSMQGRAIKITKRCLIIIDTQASLIISLANLGSKRKVCLRINLIGALLLGS